MGLGTRIARIYYLNTAIGFIVLVPVMIYKFYAMRLPKFLLLIIIPAYLVLSKGFYELYRNAKLK
jgi:hypothetical protein